MGATIPTTTVPEQTCIGCGIVFVPPRSWPDGLDAEAAAYHDEACWEDHTIGQLCRTCYGIIPPAGAPAPSNACTCAPAAPSISALASRRLDGFRAYRVAAERANTAYKHWDLMVAMLGALSPEADASWVRYQRRLEDQQDAWARYLSLSEMYRARAAW